MSDTTQARTPRRGPARFTGRNVLNLGLLGVVVLAGVLLTMAPGHRLTSAPRTLAVPHDVVMEKATGVRFSRVAVVGDGGLVTVFYVVLDPERATVFQADRDHPPRLVSESVKGGTQRASIMRAGHQMRAGQTYYLVYENTRGAIRSGGQVTITYGGMSLRHVPVL